jgi:hypothetical protein
LKPLFPFTSIRESGWRQQVPHKRWVWPIRLHGVTSHLSYYATTCCSGKPYRKLSNYSQWCPRLDVSNAPPGMSLNRFKSLHHATIIS